MQGQCLHSCVHHLVVMWMSAFYILLLWVGLLRLIAKNMAEKFVADGKTLCYEIILTQNMKTR